MKTIGLILSGILLWMIAIVISCLFIYCLIFWTLQTLGIFTGCMIVMFIFMKKAKKVKNNNDKIYK